MGSGIIEQKLIGATLEGIDETKEFLAEHLKFAWGKRPAKAGFNESLLFVITH